jgi:hypothetical protein
MQVMDIMIAEGEMTALRQGVLKTLFGVTVALFAISGCQISPRRTVEGNGSPTPTPTPGSGGQLYVASGNSILRFSNADAADGSLTPAATMTASALTRPQRLLLDAQNDRLYVAAGSSILTFDGVSTLDGSLTPARVLSGPGTGLAAPLDMALDPVANQLYVADGARILVYPGASTINGNLAPVRTINVGVTLGAILLDTANDILYVADPADNVIDVLGSASQQNVVATPTAIIAGPDTKLSGPNGLALDASGRLIVSNSVAPVSLTVYPNASAANGDVLPVATIGGNITKLSSPAQVLLNRDANNGELYVVESTTGSILVFGGFNSANGNIAPARTITSPAIAVNSIGGIALDTTR